MSTKPTIQGLKELLKRKKLGTLVEELESDSESFEDWKKRTKEDWEKELTAIKGNASGFSDIYNYLNPRREGNCVLTTGNEMDVDFPIFDPTCLFHSLIPLSPII